MFAFLLPLLAQLPGLIGNFFKQKNDLLAAQNEVQRQVELAKIDMAKDIAVSQLNLNATIIQSTSSYFKYFTFCMWFGPFMLGLVAPELAAKVFTNLGDMPQWYVESCIMIMFTVWGISVSAPIVNGIFSGLGDFFAARREHKTGLAKIDRKAYYDALRATKGFVLGEDVKEMEKVFDALEKAVEK